MTEIIAKLSTALADRYRIERHLGEGGMATVYLAEGLTTAQDRPRLFYGSVGRLRLSKR